VQVDAFEGERQRGGAGGAGDQAACGDGLERGVEEGGVAEEVAGGGAVGEVGFRVHGAGVAPQAAQALERGAVFVALVGEAVVDAVEGDFLAGRRPGGGCRGRGGRGSGEGAGGVGGPVGVRVGAGVDREGAGAGVVGGAGDGAQGQGVVAEDRRGGEGEVGDAALVRGEFDEGRAGQEDRAGDGVVGEPGVGGGVEAGGEHRAAVGEFGDRAEQRVAGGAQADGGEVTGAAALGEPVGAALERVGRQRHRPGRAAREVGAPVDGDAPDPQPGRRREEFGRAVLAAPQRSGHQALGVGLFEDLGEADGEDGVRAGLDEHAVPVGEHRLHRVLEADRSAEVVEPVGGGEGRRVGEGSGDRGVEADGSAGARGGPGGDLQDGVLELVHVRAVGGVVDGDAAGPHALGPVGVDQRFQGVRVA